MEKAILKLCAGVTLAITPWTTFDPINPPKFLLLAVIGSICALFVFQERSNLALGFWLKTSLVLILGSALLSAVLTEADLGRDLYGAYGRLFGLITIVCLVLVLVFFSSSKKTGMKDCLRIFQIVSLISITYGFLQSIGKDFAPWENPYSPIVGFLGNPNFMSSFTGISVILLSQWHLDFKKNYLKSIIAFIFQVLGVLNIIQSDSIQGIFVIGAGVLSAVLYFAINKRKRFLDAIVACLVTLFLFLIALTLDSKDPLSSAFTSGTLANRAEYWKTGLRMFLENWQLGLGPDQYGTWFRFYRPESTISLLGTEVVTDSPHNSIIDFAANFGIGSLLGYLILIFLVSFRVIRFARYSSKVSMEHVLITSAFVGYFAQSLISPNQIGLAIWGWVFMGILLGNSFKVQPGEVIENQLRQPKIRDTNRNHAMNSNKYLLNYLVGSVVGLLIASPLFYQHMVYRSALLTADSVKILNVAEMWPKQEYIKIQIVEILMQNEYWFLSKQMSNRLLADFPNSYLGWLKLYQNKQISPEEKETARMQLQRLDPLNPAWK